MVLDDPGFCPRCGSHLERCEGNPSSQSCCPVCEFVVYSNPFPVVVATVVDGDSALLVKRGRPPDAGCWSLPGGYMEMDESPSAGAARELTEETGLSADPSDLAFVGTAYERLDPGNAVVDIIFAVPRAKTRGTLVAGDDAADVRFWSRADVAADPPELRTDDATSIIWAIDTVESRRSRDAPVLW